MRRPYVGIRVRRPHARIRVPTHCASTRMRRPYRWGRPPTARGRVRSAPSSDRSNRPRRDGSTESAILHERPSGRGATTSTSSATRATLRRSGRTLPRTRSLGNWTRTVWIICPVAEGRRMRRPYAWVCVRRPYAWIRVPTRRPLAIAARAPGWAKSKISMGRRCSRQISTAT